MPVKGLTDRGSLQPRFPRLGKLRKGAKKPARGPGKDLEYFRFTSDDPDVVKAFVEAYDKAPARLEVYLPYVTPEENFETWMEEWSAGGLVHRCDGETMTIWQKGDGSYGYDKKPCPYLTEKKRTKSKPGCIIVGRLAVILPDLLRAGYVGYVTLETHSNHDLRNIMSTLLSVAEARPQGLQGIPFTVRRYKEKISTPSGENGKRARREKSLVALVPSPTWVESRMALARAEAFAALPAGDIPLTEESHDQYQSANGDDEPIEGAIEEIIKDESELEDSVLQAAMELETPSGKRFSTLDIDELQAIVEHPKATVAQINAAELVLAEKTKEAKAQAAPLDKSLNQFAEITGAKASQLKFE